MKMAAPFNATLREMVEMHYLWRLPVRLRNDKLVDFLGAEPHTRSTARFIERCKARVVCPPAR